MPAHNYRQFAMELSAMAADVPQQANRFKRRMALEILRRVVQRSPVGDANYWQSPPPKGYTGGHFRGNWQVGIGEPPSGEVPGTDPGGQYTAAAGLGELGRVQPGQDVYITNNVPYAERLEDGWSWRQAPQGIVRVTLAEMDAGALSAAGNLRSSEP